MLLIVGLGNPGSRYKYTRHNLGFMVVEQLAVELNVSFTKKKLHWIGSTIYNNVKVILLKPTTYMNLSGRSIIFAVNFYKIDLSQILVICDDVNLPFGKIRIRGKGSHGGHNGLASVIEELGTTQFSRLRIGIGAEFEKNRITDYVLSEFTDSELEKISESVHIASQVALSFITNGLVNTMNEFN